MQHAGHYSRWNCCLNSSLRMGSSLIIRRGKPAEPIEARPRSYSPSVMSDRQRCWGGRELIVCEFILGTMKLRTLRPRMTRIKLNNMQKVTAITPRERLTFSGWQGAGESEVMQRYQISVGVVARQRGPRHVSSSGIGSPGREMPRLLESRRASKRNRGKQQTQYFKACENDDNLTPTIARVASGPMAGDCSPKGPHQTADGANAYAFDSRDQHGLGIDGPRRVGVRGRCSRLALSRRFPVSWRLEPPDSIEECVDAGTFLQNHLGSRPTFRFNQRPFHKLL
jgi:hypothetical protein